MIMMFILVAALKSEQAKLSQSRIGPGYYSRRNWQRNTIKTEASSVLH